MRPNLFARFARQFALLPYFPGKNRLELWLEARVPLPERQVGTDFPDGFRLDLDPASRFERSLFFWNAEQDTYEFLKRSLRLGMIFYDCGANIGFYTLVASKLVGASGRVLAFEPAPTTFARLSANVRANAATNVSIWHVALGAKEGRATIYQPRGESHGLNTLASGGSVVGECRLTSLDSLVSRETLPAPNIIKVDVEGSELALLRGAQSLLRHWPAILVVELSRATMRPFGYQPEEVVRFLLTLRDYRVQWPFRGKLQTVHPHEPLPHYAVLGPEHGANYLFTPC